MPRPGLQPGTLNQHQLHLKPLGHPTSHIFGSYALHTDPKSEANLVYQSVCQCVRVSVDHFEDEMTRDRSPRVQVVWVLVVFKLFRWPLLPVRCSRGVFPVLGKFEELSVAISSICSR